MLHIFYKCNIVKTFMLLFIVTSIDTALLKASTQSCGLTGSDVSNATYAGNEECLFSMDDEPEPVIKDSNTHLRPSPPPSKGEIEKPNSKPEYLFEMEEDEPVKDSNAPVDSGKTLVAVAPNKHRAPLPATEYQRQRENGPPIIKKFFNKSCCCYTAEERTIF